MKKKKIFSGIVTALIIFANACKPADYYYGEYLENGEVYYPGRVDSLSIIPGNERAQLRFRATTDPKVNQVKVYLRSSLSPKPDVLSFPINVGEHGKFKMIDLNNLSEATYTANVYSFSSEKDSSRVVSASQFIYGKSYINTLVNRSFSKFDLTAPSKPYLVFARENNLPKEGSFYHMQFTEVTYLSNKGDSTKVQVTPYHDYVELVDIAKPSTLKYRTFYKPVQTSIDYFTTAFEDIEFK